MVFFLEIDQLAISLISMKVRLSLYTPILAGVVLFAGIACSDESGKKMDVVTEQPIEPTEQVVKTEEEWKKELTPEQYHILRESGTESAYGSVYKQFKAQGGGKYICVGCDTVLFSSNEKFDSGCGWPSFYDPAKLGSVKTVTDNSGGMVRTEVRCAKCDGHLGHVFKGEGFDTPTDERYCINGLVLRFVPDSEEKEEAASSEKG